MASGFRRQSREPSLRSTSGFETTRTSEQASSNWPLRKEPNQTNSIMVTRRRRRDNGPRHTGEFLEAGKKRLAGDTARAATSDEVKELRREASVLKEVVAELTLARLLEARMAK